MKKFLSLLFVALLALCLVACGDTGADEPADKEQGSEEAGDKDKDQGETEGDASSYRDVKVDSTDLANVLGTGKLYVTTFGQASFKYMVQIVDDAIEGSAVTYEEDKLLTADQVSAGDVVIAVVGYTSKGIDTKAITVVSETARAKAFAEKEGITLIICQLDGKDRRGESSDPIIEAATAGADYVFVYEDGGSNGANYDGKYTSTWAKNAKYYEFSNEYDMVDFIAKLVK